MKKRKHAAATANEQEHANETKSSVPDGEDHPIAAPLSAADLRKVHSVLDELNVEVESRCDLLKHSADTLAFSLQCAFNTQLAKLPKRVRAMPISELVGQFAGDMGAVRNDQIATSKREFDTWVAATPGAQARAAREMGMETPATVRRRGRARAAAAAAAAAAEASDSDVGAASSSAAGGAEVSSSSSFVVPVAADGDAPVTRTVSRRRGRAAANAGADELLLRTPGGPLQTPAASSRRMTRSMRRQLADLQTPAGGAVLRSAARGVSIAAAAPGAGAAPADLLVQLDNGVQVDVADSTQVGRLRRKDRAAMLAKLQQMNSQIASAVRQLE